MTRVREKQMAEVFISYRRADSEWSSGRIFDRLEQALGLGKIFLDVSGIEPGEDFHHVLEQQVAQCSVCLAIIGPQWAALLRDRRGHENDFVRIELSIVLRRNIRLIPILIDGASMPHESELPDDLKPLARRNAIVIRADRFRADVDQLAEFLVSRIGSRPSSKAISAGNMAGASNIAPSSAISQELGSFRDVDIGPDMAIVPAGNFVIGPPADAAAEEVDLHSSVSVSFLRPFAISATPITVGEFANFVKSAGYADALFGMWSEKAGKFVQERGRHFRNPGFIQDDTHPAIGLSWHDAAAYASWLQKKTGFHYSLPSEAQWEYAARAGLPRLGASLDFAPRGAEATDDATDDGGVKIRTKPVRWHRPNPWGIYLVFGQVWEWCEDFWHPNYTGIPQDGSSWTKDGDPSFRVVRGGCAGNMPLLSRARGPSLERMNDRFGDLGFRVVRTL